MGTIQERLEAQLKNILAKDNDSAVDDILKAYEDSGIDCSKIKEEAGVEVSLEDVVADNLKDQ